VTHAMETASSSRPGIEAVSARRLSAFRTKDSVRSNDARNARDNSRQIARDFASNAVRNVAPSAVVTPEEVLLRNALEEMFGASRSKFVSMANSILLNREDAEEAVQEAFLSAHCHLRKFEGRSALKTWLTRIVLNSALMMRRKRKPIVIKSLSETDGSSEEDWTESIPDLQPNPEMIHGARETFQVIDGVLDKMKPVLRHAFMMTYYDDLSREEASAKLRVSVGTFKARLFRARRLVLDKTARSQLTPLHKTLASSSESWRRRGFHGFHAPRL
jgi:RNA polymerase sigma-70 factor, ECF subfamily